MSEEVCHIFVYGTLRPDDDSGAPWKTGFLNGTVQQKAILPDAGLFFYTYPSVAFQLPGRTVVGYVISCQTREEFVVKLQLGDEIEGCPSHYRRDVVDVRLVDERKTVKAFVYHQPACRQGTYIESGDWLKRDGVTLNPDDYSDSLPSL